MFQMLTNNSVVQNPVAQEIQEQVTNEDEEMNILLTSLLDSKCLPIRRNRLKGFETNEKLMKIRMYSSPVFVHRPAKIKYLNALSSNSNRGRGSCKTPNDTVNACAICLVPLCVKNRTNPNNNSCFKLWHSRKSLRREKKRILENLEPGTTKTRIKDAQVTSVSEQDKKRRHDALNHRLIRSTRTSKRKKTQRCTTPPPAFV